MPTTYKILGQLQPSTTGNENLYTVPASTQTIISSLVVANTTATQRTIRIFIRNDGAAAGLGNAIVYDANIAANSQVGFSLGITMDASDIITVQASAANAITFHAFGSELT